MGHLASRALAGVGVALLGAIALLALAATAAYVLVASPTGRAFVTPRLLALVDDAIAGSLELDGVGFEGGGLVLRGARVKDPDGEVVISVERAFAAVDLTRLRARSVGVHLDLERPTVLLAQDEQGRLGVARAFAPTRPSPREEQPGGESRWTVHVTRLALRGGAVRWVRASGEEPFAVSELELDLAGEHGPAGSRVALRANAALRAPAEQPVSLEAAATLRRGEVALPLLRAKVGDTALDLVAEGDLAARSGRAAALQVAVSREGLRAFEPRAPLAGDLAGSAYAETDGATATAALRVRPADGNGDAGADAAAAVRLAAPLAAGLDLAARHLDPARLVAAAPAGDLTFTARGRVAGTDPATLRGALALDVAPSRLRGGRVTSLALRATADRGLLEVARLDATLPGARLAASGRHRLSGAASATARLDAADVGAAVQNAAALAGAKAPAVRGAARLWVAASGRAGALQGQLTLDAPRLAVRGAALAGLALRGEVTGPARAPRVKLEGSAASLAAAGRDARDLSLLATVEGRAAEARLSALVRQFGDEPVTVAARGALSPDGSVAEVADLALSWPGSRLALARPARVTLAGPRVDRLELAGDGQRIALEGGLVPRRRGRAALDARLVLERLDLARLPRGLLPAELGLAGAVSVDATARGDAGAPRVEGRVEVEDAAAYGLTGLSLAGDGAYDGPLRRARVSVGLRRAGGGEVEVRADLPVQLGRAPPAEALTVRARVRELPVAEALRVARAAAPLRGLVDLDLAVSGTVRAPSIEARAALEDGRWGEQGPFGVGAALEAPGGEARVEALLDFRGARALEVRGAVPLEPAELLRDPARAVARLPRAPLEARVDVPGLDLALLAGVGGLPADLAGHLVGDGTFGGSARAPRGELGLAASGVAGLGRSGGEAQVVVALGEGVTALSGRAALRGAELVGFSGALFAPPEALAVDPAAAERAQLELELNVPDLDLARVSGRTPFGGTLRGELRATGSLQAPTVDLALDGKALVLSGRPLGDLQAKGHAGRGGIDAQARLAAFHGGTLAATFSSDVDVGLGPILRGDLANAPARAHVVAERLALAFLPAALPGVVRSAGGELAADVRAEGTFSRLRPVGTLRVSGGRLAVTEVGEWTGIELDAALSDDELRVARLEAHRGSGRMEGKVEARGLALRGGPGEFTAELRARDLGIPRAGQEILRLEAVDATAKGTFDAKVLRAEVRVPRATIRLPKRTPRALQPLDRRDDIVIGEPKKRGPRHGEGVASGEEEGYRVVVHTVVPNRFFVKSDNPRVDVELKADFTLDILAARIYSEGTVDVIRGEVEPIGGRRFQVERGRVTFTGGEPKDAVLDVIALYENPAANVTVTVTGPTSAPQVKMTSEPPMDEAQIAMLIATGRTQLKAGGGGVGTFTGEEAGKAALGVVATQVFKGLVADKLPLDTVALESTQRDGVTTFNLRAGKYVTDKIYVGYTRDFEAQLEEGENQNEVRVEFQITSRWTFESRYGDGKSGGASLIWSKDY
jgi:translocation and assembly module TamB